MPRPDNAALAVANQRFGDVLRLLRLQKGYKEPQGCGCSVSHIDRAPRKVEIRCAHLLWYGNAYHHDRCILQLLADLQAESRTDGFIDWWRVAVRRSDGLEAHEVCWCSRATTSEASRQTVKGNGDDIADTDLHSSTDETPELGDSGNIPRKSAAAGDRPPQSESPTYESGRRPRRTRRGNGRSRRDPLADKTDSAAVADCIDLTSSPPSSYTAPSANGTSYSTAACRDQAITADSQPAGTHWSGTPTLPPREPAAEARRRRLDPASNLQSGGRIRGVVTVPSEYQEGSRGSGRKSSKEPPRHSPSLGAGTSPPPPPSKKRKHGQLTDELGSPEMSAERDSPRQSLQGPDARCRIDGFSGDDTSYIEHLINLLGKSDTIDVLENRVATQRKSEAQTLAQTILRFQKLVTDSRKAPLLKTKLPDKDDELLGTLYKLHHLHDVTESVNWFYRTITGIQLVQHIDKMTKRGRLRADPESLSLVCKQLGMTAVKLRRRMKPYRGLNELLGPHKGAECFIPFDRLLHGKTYIDSAATESIRQWIDETSHLRTLCDFGRCFLNCLLSAEDYPEHLWQSWTLEERMRLNADALMDLLLPYKLPDWARPEGWPWDWPARPDIVIGDPQCEFCDKPSCECLTRQFRWDFTVGLCGGKGQGLLAGVPGRNTTVFTKDEPLGRLLGEFVAPNTVADGWGLELKRKDLTGSPVVAHIYARRRGNEFRLVNHACRDSASAIVQCMRISGVFAPIFYARRDLKDGDEITVNWGEGYMAKKDCLCDQCTRK